jgi:hypothetical protein
VCEFGRARTWLASLVCFALRFVGFCLLCPVRPWFARSVTGCALAAGRMGGWDGQKGVSIERERESALEGARLGGQRG